MTIGTYPQHMAFVHTTALTLMLYANAHKRLIKTGK